MSKSQRSVNLAGVLLVSLLSAAPACAQLPVSWVSASGDNASPCTRTLPCRDIGVAIGNTIAGGEVRALNSGPYFPVRIDKSISIVGTEIRIVPYLPNGISVWVSAGKEDVVNLRGLVIDGVGIGGEGVYFESGGALHIQNSVIRNYKVYGIEFTSAYDSQLFVSDTLIADIGVPSTQVIDAAIKINTDAPQRSGIVLDRVRIENSQTGISVGNYTPGAFSFLMRDSTVSGSAWSGIEIENHTNFAPQIVIDRSAVVNNGLYGISASFPATVHISNSNVTGNGTGLYSFSGSAFDLRPNTTIIGNGINIDAPPSDQ